MTYGRCTLYIYVRAVSNFMAAFVRISACQIGVSISLKWKIIHFVYVQFDTDRIRMNRARSALFFRFFRVRMYERIENGITTATDTYEMRWSISVEWIAVPLTHIWYFEFEVGNEYCHALNELRFMVLGAGREFYAYWLQTVCDNNNMIHTI